MQTENTKQHTCSKRRRRGARFNIVVSLLLGAGMLAAANWCSSMLFARWRFVGAPALSQRSEEFLGAASGMLRISAVFNASHPFRREAFDLLDSISDAAARNPSLKLETRKLDPGLDFAECVELFRSSHAEANSFIIESGANFVIIGEGDYTAYSDIASDAPDLFTGESVCVSEMISLLKTTRPRVYFTEGRGELDPSDENSLTGASAIAAALSLNGYTVRKTDLGAQALPADCDALVIAGPKSPFLTRAVEAVRAYIAKGGSVIFLFDEPAAAGFAAELVRLGVDIAREPLRDAPAARAEFDSTAAHPAVAPLRNTSVFFSAPLPLSTANAASSATSASPTAKLRPLLSTHENTSDSGAAMLALAVEIPSYGEGIRNPEARLIVCGDSAFIANANIENGLEGNAVFFLSSINWLASQKDLPSHPAAVAVSGQRHFRSGIDGDAAWRTLMLRSAVYYPAALLAFGLLIYIPWSRRS